MADVRDKLNSDRLLYLIFGTIKALLRGKKYLFNEYFGRKNLKAVYVIKMQ